MKRGFDSLGPTTGHIGSLGLALRIRLGHIHPLPLGTLIDTAAIATITQAPQSNKQSTSLTQSNS